MNHCKELYYTTFKHFNNLMFDNAIPMPKIKAFNSKKYAGYFIGSVNEDGEPTMTIKISTKYNKDYQSFCETLLHEMVHCYQYLNHFKVGHGKSFKLMAKKINKQLGMQIE